MTGPMYAFLALAISGVMTCAAEACPSGTCPTSTQAAAKPFGGQAAQPYAAVSLAALDDSPTLTVAPQVDAQVTGTYLQRQAFDCSDFQRGSDGSWTAIRAVTFPAPGGPLKVDTESLYRPDQSAGGYDLGAMLEHDCPSR